MGTTMPNVMDLNGEWAPKDSGSADTFMEAAGIGWVTRKAIGVAQAAGFGQRNYTIEVTESEGHYQVHITDGKRDNTFPTDGSTFEYDGPTGKGPTTCVVEDGMLVITSAGAEDGSTPDIVTYRWVNEEGLYVTRATVPSKEGCPEWVRTCSRV